MARNKLASAARLHHRERRDTRRLSSRGQETLSRTAANDSDPGEIVAGRDLLDRFRRLPECGRGTAARGMGAA